MNRCNLTRVCIALVVGIGILAAVPVYGLVIAAGWAWRLWIASVAYLLGLLLYAGEDVSPVPR